jgi:diguanylate cyclase (GGDEF)-like protein/PAS domain S-box-containing protein
MPVLNNRLAKSAVGGGGVKKYRAHLLVLFVVGVAWLTALHGVLENALIDMRFSLLSRQASGDIVVVAIDPQSIEKVGTWPWPRGLHGQLIDRLQSAGVSDIAFDVDFSSPSIASEDLAFLDALRKAGGSVVLPAFKQKTISADDNGIHVNRPLPRLGENAWEAMVNVGAEPDGVVRRYPYGDVVGGAVVPSMAAILGANGKLRAGSFWIDFSIPVESVPVVSYVSVLRGDQAVLASLRDKKVIVGGTALELGDRLTTPHGRIIAGPMLQALAAESILQDRDLQRTPAVFALPFIALLVLGMLALWRLVSAGPRAALLLGLSAAVEAGAMLLQSRLPIVVDTSLVHVAIGAYLVVIALDEIDLRGMLSRIAHSRFERIAMALGDGLVCADHNGRITLWNPGAAAIFGYAPEEMVGRPIAELFVADSVPGEAFALTAMPRAELQSPGGRVIELAGRRRNGELFPLEACFSGWDGADGFQYGVVLRDISVRKREAEKVRYLAEFDTVTGLANRNTLHQHLGRQLAEVQAHGQKLALLLLDLDSFKEVNDTLGHACGDEMLAGVGRLLNGLVGSDGFLARLGGDEFAIVLAGDDVAARAQTLAGEIISAFRQTAISVGEHDLVVNGSIGIVVYPDHGAGVQELLGNVDLALYRAKGDGRGRHLFFERRMRSELEKRLALESELKRALENNEFELFYQPQIDLRTGTLVGAEALIRWRHPERGLVSPGEFISVVNASPMANDIGCWVLASACMQGRRWQEQGHAIRIGVNLSPSQLQSGDLSVLVGAVLQATGFSASLLELEVTEDIVLADEQRAIGNFRALQELGVTLAFDDFGTGYAGLSYLKKFPLNVLKIDRTFVSGPVHLGRRHGDRQRHHRHEPAARLEDHRRGHRGRRHRRGVAGIRLRRRPGLSLRQADAGRGIRAALPDAGRCRRNAGGRRRLTPSFVVRTAPRSRRAGRRSSPDRRA